MSTIDKSLWDDLQSRGLVAQTTHPEALQQALNKESITLYCGFDPSADSLHVGSLIPLITLQRFQRAGHHVIALLGGATGLIGDPSFKAQERSLNTATTVQQWGQQLTQQIERLLNTEQTNTIKMVDNVDWIQSFDVLTFLRDIGKHFAVNSMIKKESVKQRIERDGEGLSFTEFSYMILQSLDFAMLYRDHGCTLQIGGSDQWGNITGGIELTRRLHNGHVFGLTLPLLTQANGTKFGKTEAGTIWLDPAKTSAYRFYQFWLQTADQDVYRFLRYFTFLSIDEIQAIEDNDRQHSEPPEAQAVLARQLTQWVHGQAGLEAAERITHALFKDTIDSLTANDFQQLHLDGLPTSPVPTDQQQTLTQWLSECGTATSAKQAKDALTRGALRINNRVIDPAENMALADCFAPQHALFKRYYLVKIGKKNYHLVDREKC